jgi:signal transduction histidine kinase
MKGRDFCNRVRWRRAFWGGEASGMVAEESGRASFRTLLARVFPMEPYVRRFFALLFWVYFGVTYVTFLLDGRGYGIGIVTLAFVVLLICWLLLPWSPQVPLYRSVGAPVAFVAASFVVVHLTGFGLAVGLFSIPVADVVYLFGFWRGLACAVVLLPLIFADRLWSEPGLGIGGSLERTAYWSLAFAFVIGMCAMALEAVRREERAENLFAELEKANSELKSHAEQAKKLAISEERNRMAREIHDVLGHHLVVVNVQLEAAGKLLDRDPKEAREAVARAKTAASETLSEVRRSVRALGPLALEKRTGHEALAALAREFRGTGIAVSFEVTGRERGLSPEAQLLLYRALEEGLTNALKYSGGSRVEARLAFEPSGVRLTVADNGRGPSGNDHGLDGTGFGIPGLRERASALGGTVSADAADGGFVLEVELPTIPAGVV